MLQIRHDRAHHLFYKVLLHSIARTTIIAVDPGGLEQGCRFIAVTRSFGGETIGILKVLAKYLIVQSRLEEVNPLPCRPSIYLSGCQRLRRL